MAKFDLGEIIVAREVPVGPTQAYRLSRRILEGYEGMGYQVAFEDEQPPRSMRARIGGKGTNISTRVDVEQRGDMTAVTIVLAGKVEVTGAKAMFATPPMVKKIARQKLEGLVDVTFHNVEREPETSAAAPAPASGRASALPPAAGGRKSIEERLRTVKMLYEKGLIKESDFRAKKTAILECL